MSDFASYEKHVEDTVVRTKHYVRPSIHMTAFQIVDIMKHVPPGAVLVSIESDEDCEPACPPHGELVFEEEQREDGA